MVQTVDGKMVVVMGEVVVKGVDAEDRYGQLLVMEAASWWYVPNASMTPALIRTLLVVGVVAVSG